MSCELEDYTNMSLKSLSFKFIIEFANAFTESLTKHMEHFTVNTTNPHWMPPVFKALCIFWNPNELQILIEYSMGVY